MVSPTGSSGKETFHWIRAIRSSILARTSVLSSMRLTIRVLYRNKNVNTTMPMRIKGSIYHQNGGRGMSGLGIWISRISRLTASWMRSLWYLSSLSFPSIIFRTVFSSWPDRALRSSMDMPLDCSLSWSSSSLIRAVIFVFSCSSWVILADCIFRS